ncbi:YqeG family HAD IIIA-type phosphatase [Ruminococcaceae bacterium OttesenSCG-928-O06]|nr:YqeG family HAD IIIA-type phosphatase [Ruminococcaceae bacterium OttesenSCG-928-O06]
MSLFVPQYLFRDVTRISPEFLRGHGIQGLVLDVDNTLTGHDSNEVRPDIAAWLQTMRQNGVRLMLASNNTRQRVAPFADKIGLDYISFSCKPSPFWLLAARRRWRLPRRAIALVGDQIFTDLLAGSLYGAQVLLVRPMYENEKPSVRMKRAFEKPLLLRYYKNGGTLM